MSTQLIIDIPITPGVPPKPKGSLRHVGNNRMVEQVKGSRAWRETVAWHARAAMTKARWQTTTQPVSLKIVVQLPTKGSKNPEPTGQNTGDIDKHARNILDALADAGVYANDSQVVFLSIRKGYAPDHAELSASILVEVQP